MRAPKVLFRVESGPGHELGTGHLYRSFALAGALGRKLDIAFCSKGGPALERVLGSAFPRFVLNGGDPKRSFQALLRNYRPSAVVFDKLDNREWELRSARNSGARVVTFDDNSRAARRWADLRVDGVLATPFSSLSGYRFLVLPPVRIFRPKRARRECRRVFVFLGGYDRSRAAVRILKMLRLSKRFMESFRGEIVYVGGKDAEADRAHAIDFGRRIRLKRYFQTPKFNALLASSDVAILSGGLALFQALRMGTPAVVVCQYPHQEKAAGFLSRRAAVLYAGRAHALRSGVVLRHLLGLMDDAARRKRMAARGRRLIDGRGLRRVSKALLSFLKKTDARRRET